MKYTQPHDLNKYVGKRPETPYEWYLFWLLAQKRFK